MQFTLGFLALFLGLSASLNVFLFQQIKLLKANKNNKTYDATALMHDLTRGSGLVKVTRVNPEDVFVRSPRDASR